MAKITYAPIKELVVHDAVNIDYEDLLRERITPAGNMPLYWCSGILFSFNSMPLTEEIVKDYLGGTIHWLEVHYSPMKDYQPIVELKDEQYNATMKIRVIDTSRSGLHAEFIKWLKAKR
jgi:hypothetical protein